jgi:predicted alpha/beta hydrolase family esterase
LASFSSTDDWSNRENNRLSNAKLDKWLRNEAKGLIIFPRALMKTSDATILFIPGLNGSGPDHWQSRWQAKLTSARRVEQPDWDNPVAAHWIQNLVIAIETAEKPVILVAHSLGSTTLVKAAPLIDPNKIAGAFIVAPPAADILAEIPGLDPAFAEKLTAALPFKSLLIASRNDPFSAFELSEQTARHWGATFIDAGEAGHINTESGHGPWPEGLMSFAAFLNKL